MERMSRGNKLVSSNEFQTKAKHVFSHIGPKLSEKQLYARSNAYYQTAIAYYEAKERMFIDKIIPKILPQFSQDLFSFNKYMEETLRALTYNDKESKNMYNYLFEILNEGQKSQSAVDDYLKKNYDSIPFRGQEVIVQWRKDTDGKFNKPFWNSWANTQLGKQFEEKYVIEIFNDLMKEAISILGDKFIGDIRQIGNNFVKSYIRDGAKQSLIDILFMVEESKLNLKGSQITDYDGVELELQSNLDIAKIEDVAKNEELEKYLKSEMAGFSVKAWSKSALLKGAQKEFATSSILQNQLNSKLETRDEEGYWHTWEPSYAMTYTMNFLARRLFNILSPAQIGFILTDGIYLFSDFLKENMFYMTLVGSYPIYWDRHKDWNSETLPSDLYQYVKFRSTMMRSANGRSAKKTNKKEARFQAPTSQIMIQTLVKAHSSKKSEKYKEAQFLLDKVIAGGQISRQSYYNAYDKAGSKINNSQIVVKPMIRTK